jgi:plastocyanin
LDIEEPVMRHQIRWFLAACGAMALIAANPATQPATTIVRGHVTVSGGLFDRPDVGKTVIFIASDPVLDKIADPTTQAIVAQHDKRFEPDFTVVSRGTVVEFPNWDHFYHNVFSRSAAAPAFDLERYGFGQSKIRTFDKVGVVQLFCNIHPQMRAIIYVTPNRFFVRPDSNGDFELRGVPPGDYRIVAWHDRCAEQTQPLHLGADGQANFSFQLSIRRGGSDADPPAAYGVGRGLGVKRQQLNLPVVAGTHPAPEDSRP